MPRGISETDVHQAADALVAQGERPTVDRIRAYLGTGSPNTVTRWLETWWHNLSRRLQAGAPRLDGGSPPSNVAALAQQCWDLAVSHAHAVAAQALAADRGAVQSRADALARSEAQISQERDAWAEERTALTLARDLAQRGVSDLEAHLQALGRHLDELKHQHAQVDTERANLLTQLLMAQAATQAVTIAANKERSEREQSHRAAEDRWMQEVDRTREALKSLQKEKASQREEHLAREASTLGQLEKSKSSLVDLQSAFSHLQGRAQALEQQIIHLEESQRVRTVGNVLLSAPRRKKGEKRTRSPGASASQSS